MLARAAEDPRLANVMFAGQGEAPQIRLDIDRRKAETLGVSMDEINTTLAVMFGSDYIGDFMHGSQVRKVVVQADGAKRLGIDDIGRFTCATSRARWCRWRRSPRPPGPSARRN